MNKDFTVFTELLEEIYKGIENVHPNITPEQKEEYARIALYMIYKNKTEMAIHAPKKSYKRWQKALLELKKQNEQQEAESENIIDIEAKRKMHK